MLHGKKLVVVLPAYRAERTLAKTYAEIPRDIVDDVLLIDDASTDATASVARELGIKTYVHQSNRGYGGNQKTCYQLALEAGADVVVMLHPDYQYDPGDIPALAEMVACGKCDVVLASRISGGKAIAGGMPMYKYLANRVLTIIENLLLGTRLSEFHTGYRAYSRKVLEALPLLANSDDFVFDNQILAQAVAHGFPIGEIASLARYRADSSSISFVRSCRYGLGVLKTGVAYRLWKWGMASPAIFTSGEKSKIRAEAALPPAVRQIG